MPWVCFTAIAECHLITCHLPLVQLSRYNHRSRGFFWITPTLITFSLIPEPWQVGLLFFRLCLFPAALCLSCRTVCVHNTTLNLEVLMVQTHHQPKVNSRTQSPKLECQEGEIWAAAQAYCLLSFPLSSSPKGQEHLAAGLAPGGVCRVGAPSARPTAVV